MANKHSLYGFQYVPEVAKPANARSPVVSGDPLYDQTGAVLQDENGNNLTG